MRRKRTLLVLHIKKYLCKIFLKFSAKRALCALGYIFNKVSRGVDQKPDEAGTKNGPAG